MQSGDLSSEAIRCVFQTLDEQIPAGSSFSIEARVRGLHKPELEGAVVCIRDAEGVELSRASLSAESAQDDRSGEDGQTARMFVRAPAVAGEHVYTGALLVRHGDNLVEAVANPIGFVVSPHEVVLSAWKIPSATAAGERLSFAAGLKCTCGCDLLGQYIRVFDAQDKEVAAGVTGGVWPGTVALFFADIEVPAPAEAGDFSWSVRYNPSDDIELPHEQASHTFIVKVVPAPETEVTVQAFDIEKQKPVAGAHVLLHPYRTLTDAEGRARFSVARGQYRLVVSGFQYVPFEQQITADERVSVRVELREETPVNYWTV
jgi:hypothetical protein